VKFLKWEIISVYWWVLKGEGHPLVKFVVKTKSQPKAITSFGADSESNEKRQPSLYTGKGEEKED
jgi:hypothetical protein